MYFQWLLHLRYNLLKSRVSEICIIEILVIQGLGVHPSAALYEFFAKKHAMQVSKYTIQSKS